MSAMLSRVALATLATLLGGGAAAAQPSRGGVRYVEVPAVVLDPGDAAAGPSADDALDLANIVQSAAKGVTTVQEAPAIVTVVTADEIRDRQFRDLQQLYDTVPGWQTVGLYHSAFYTPLVRGQVQAVQYLHDGLSLFDPFVNVPAATRALPMELVKRVEMITGPGGVLWGSNSLLGILNVITKDAEDLEGVEVGGSLGHGPGDRYAARAYAMAGDGDLLGGKLKAFAHGSVETYQGPELMLPLLLYHGALPQPNSTNLYGPLTATDQAQSVLVSLTGKLTYYRYSGYPSGLSEITLRNQLAKFPDRVITAAVKGMLPDGALGRNMLKKLKVYAGEQHPHEAQKPKVLEFGVK
jgi:outer membrane receptor protein involved in Fe transport